MTTPINTQQQQPDPKSWEQFITKMVQLASKPFDLTDKIKSVHNPMFIVLGDSDGILPEHAAEMFRLAGGVKNGDMAGLPNSQLAVFPGTSHTGVIMRTDWLLSMVPAFLDK